MGGIRETVLVKNTGGIYFLNRWGLICYGLYLSGRKPESMGSNLRMLLMEK